MLSDEEIQHRYGYHPGNDDTIPRHEAIRKLFIEFAKDLEKLVPDGRAKTLMQTNLQQASMWANYGVAELAPVVLPESEVSPSQGLLL